MHPDLLLDVLTIEQLNEWEAYDRLDPIGEWRDDFRMAYLSSLIVNTARAIHGKRGVKMTTPIEFMPMWDEEFKVGPPIKKQSAEEMKQMLLSIVAAQNKKMGIRSGKKDKIPPPMLRRGKPNNTKKP